MTPESAAFRPLRIGLIFEYGSLNGGEFSLLTTLDCLPREELFPVALAPVDGPLGNELRKRAITQRSTPTFSASGSGESLDRQWEIWLTSIVHELDLQLLHANSLMMSRRLGRIAAGLPCRTTGHVRDIMTLSGSAAAALNQHDGLVAVSRAVEESLQAQRISSEKIECIYNGVNLERFCPRKKTGWLLQMLRLPPETQLAATIGQICLRKGQNDLATAAALLRDRFPNLHFLLIGQRHSTKRETIAFDERITETFCRAGMEDRLHRLSFRLDIPDILNEIDVLIHPARQEPLGRVLLEAAASGRPIVATDVGGTREILTHEESGWLVPAGDPMALAEGVAVLLNRPELAQRLGSSAHAQMQFRFQDEASAGKLLRFWHRILEHPSPST